MRGIYIYMCVCVSIYLSIYIYTVYQCIVYHIILSQFLAILIRKMMMNYFGWGFPNAINNCTTGWWFGTLLMFPYIGNKNPNWLIFFQRGWNHQPVIHYVYNFLKRNIPRITNSALTVDKPWKDLPRAWNDLSRAWTGVPEFLTNVSFFCYCKVLDSPKNAQQFGFQSGYSWWHTHSETYSIKA